MHLISKGKTVGISQTPSFRQVINLRFVRQIAMELDVRKLCVPQADNPLGSPNVRTQTHTDTKLVKPIVDRFPQLSFDGLSHKRSMERERIRIKLPCPHADDAARSVFNMHGIPSLVYLFCFHPTLFPRRNL